jgi:hypothetical protein
MAAAVFWTCIVALSAAPVALFRTSTSAVPVAVSPGTTKLIWEDDTYSKRAASPFTSTLVPASSVGSCPLWSSVAQAVDPARLAPNSAANESGATAPPG